MNLEQTLKNIFNIKKNEKVVILTDKLEIKNAKLFFNAAKKLSENTRILVKPVGDHSGQEPSPEIAREMKNSDVLIIVTTHSLTHTKAVASARKKGVRISSMPGFQKKMIRALNANPLEMKKTGIKIRNALEKAKMLNVVSDSGTDISFKVRKKIEIDYGLFRKKGDIGNLPAGEVYFAPIEGSSNGKIVIDSMKNCKCFAKKGTVVTVKDGKVVDISDKKSTLAKYLSKIKNADNIAEFGIGINRKAKVIGFILQDEKASGTCHIAFGNSKAIGGKVYSEIHVDAIIFKPTIYADEKIIMKKGRLVV